MCQVQAKSGGGGGGYDLVEIDVDTGGVTVRRALPDYTPMVPANDTAGGATQCSFSASTGMLAVLFNEVDPDAAAFVRAKKLALLVRVQINPRTRAPPHTLSALLAHQLVRANPDVLLALLARAARGGELRGTAIIRAWPACSPD